jgi:hypothetical protein
MSFSRIKYDNEAYNLKLNRSVGPGDYRLFKGYNESCDKCYSVDGPRNSKSDVAISAKTDCDNQWSSMAEVESHLTNRINKLVDFNAYGANDGYKNVPIVQTQSCNNNLVSEDTRFTYPLEAYRSMDLTSYHYVPYLFTNPQCELQSDRIGSNSRLKVKDSFKPIVTKPIDQTTLLPRGKQLLDDELSQPSSLQNMCKNLLN